MTNSYHGDKSSDWFKTFSFSVAIVSLAAVSLIGALVITDESSIAHGESLDNPNELNAEFFVDDSADNNRVADANNDVTSDVSDRDNARGILAQADDGAQSSQCDYLTENLRIDMSNDSQQVYRLQAFLQSYAYDYVDLTGQFDEDTLRAVQAFQTRHAEDILEPWGYESDEATGYVYITTRQKINEIYCDQELELTASQQDEIANYREKLNRWRAQGAEFDTPQYLAQYRGQQNQTATNETNNTQSDASEDDEVAIETNDTNQDSTNNSDDETGNDSETVSGTSATATESEEEADDGPGFFAQLFGQNDSDENDNADNQATSATNTDDSDDMTATTTDDQVAATSGVDQAATSVYSGVNSFVGFIFSPTFLLILLGVLILLLIATLLEDEDDDAYEEITADDFAKDFEDVDQEAEDTDEADDDTVNTETDSEDASESAEEESDSKTKSANFDDTPAGDNGSSSSKSKDNDSSSTSSSS